MYSSIRNLSQVNIHMWFITHCIVCHTLRSLINTGSLTMTQIVVIQLSVFLKWQLRGAST